MFFTALILISVDGEHDCLEQRVNLGHRDQSAKVSDVPGLRLQKKEKISVFLRLIVVRETTLLHLKGILKMAGNFILLRVCKKRFIQLPRKAYLLQSHAILDKQCNSRVQVANILF